MRLLSGIGAVALVFVALTVPSLAAAGSARVAALQTALEARSLYGGYVDGVRGPLTRSAVVAFQRRHGLGVDGIAGPQTRRALGWRGRPLLGSRAIGPGDRGWDVAALQYLLQREGHGPGKADGRFGPLTAAAVLRAQRAAGVGVDGIAGPVTIASLRGGGGGSTGSTPGAPTGPVAFLRPVSGLIGDGFGAPRAGGRSHQGLDFPVAYGTASGRRAMGRRSSRATTTAATATSS